MEQKDSTGISVKSPDYKNVPSPWGDDLEEALTPNGSGRKKSTSPVGRTHSRFERTLTRASAASIVILRLLLALYWFVLRKSKFLVHYAVERKAVPRWMAVFKMGAKRQVGEAVTCSRLPAYILPATICQEKGAENNVKSREDILCG